MSTYLKTKDRLSRKVAIQKIVVHARFGDHRSDIRPKTNDEVELYFRSVGIEPKELIQQMRNPNESLPYFENLAGSMWTIVGGKASIINEIGEVESEIDGEGQISVNACQSHFETAIKARDRAVSEGSYMPVYECLTFGFASIEAFLNNSAKRWSRNHPDQPLSDSASQKVSLEAKIDTWVPIMSGGAKFDKASNRQWSDFKTLKRLRDNYAIHPSNGSHGMTFQEMAATLNIFRDGIAHLLGNLHVLVGAHVPAVIINAIYFPDIEVHRD